MLKSLTAKFKKNPSTYYAMSIAATWANAGSLLNGITIARSSGTIPFVLWAIGNTLACIVFGIFAPAIPNLRDVFRSRPMQFVMGIMCPFQCWISMNGIHTVFASTVFGPNSGAIIALAFAVFFIVLLYRFGMIRNVLSDHISWSMVYIIIALLSIVTIIAARGNTTIPHLGTENVSDGIKNCILLIPGAFLYPYYYSLLDYNDKNNDGTANINIRRAFISGGIIFGIYLLFVFVMSLAELSPVLNIVYAVLVTLVAVSSLSSFQHSIYLTFGRKTGLTLNILTAALWQLLIPLGVMGAWTLMASIRIYIVCSAVAAAIAWHLIDMKKAVAACRR